MNKIKQELLSVVRQMMTMSEIATKEEFTKLCNLVRSLDGDYVVLKKDKLITELKKNIEIEQLLNPCELSSTVDTGYPHSTFYKESPFKIKTHVKFYNQVVYDAPITKLIKENYVEVTFIKQSIQSIEEYFNK